MARLTLGEEVNSRAVAAHVEIVLQTFAGLYPQLRQIVPPVVSEQQNAARLQVLAAAPHHLSHSEIVRQCN